MMTPHGPDVDAFEKASNAELKPVKLDATLVRVCVGRWECTHLVTTPSVVTGSVKAVIIGLLCLWFLHCALSVKCICRMNVTFHYL